MNVYVIECKYNGHMNDALTRRDALGVQIIALAAAEEKEIYFHALPERLVGAPALIVECDEGFLKKVSTLEGVAKAYDRWNGVATARSDKLKKYFALKPAPKKPKFGP